MLDSYFKYLSVAGATAVLAGRTLRWTTCPNFNDPSDMQIDLGIEVDRDEVAARTLELMWRRIDGDAAPSESPVAQLLDQNRNVFFAMGRHGLDEHFRPAILKSLDKLQGATKKFCDELRGPLSTSKVICFSARKDSILMWSHYAESHAGLVLEFRNIDGLDSPYKVAKPIHYSERAPQFAEAAELSALLAGESGIDDAIFDRMVYTKAAEWRYEEEWRVQSGQGREPGKPYEDVPFAMEELHAVYFGCKTSQTTKNHLQPLIRHAFPHTEIWCARRETHTYDLAFDRVTFGD